MKYLLLLFILMFISCKSIEGYKINDYKENCFSKKEIKELIINHHIEKSDYPKKTFFIGSILKNKNSCIGLYSYRFMHRPLAHYVTFKVLKFENNIYAFNTNDTIKNKNKINEFIKLYKSEFSKKDLDSIKFEFLKGDKLIGRFY